MGAGACAGSDEVDVRGRRVSAAEVSGSAAACASAEFASNCATNGGIGTLCDGEAPLCCFEAVGGEALCVDDENAFGDTSSTQEPLTLGGGTLGGTTVGISACAGYITVCTWDCTEPTGPDDIYHCTQTCRQICIS